MSVELEPVPAITGTRPFVTRTTVSMTSRSSLSLMAGVSPVVPQGTRPWMPFCIWNSTMPSRASTSTSPFLNGVTRAVNAPLNISLLQFEFFVKAPDRLLHLCRGYDACYLDLRGRDHPDGDVFPTQCVEHLRRVAGAIEHPRSYHAYLAQVLFSLDPAAQRFGDLTRQAVRFGEPGATDREGHVGCPLLGGALDDGVHRDARLGSGGGDAQ